MTQSEFERRGFASWNRFETMLDALDERKPIDVSDFAAEYRRICHHLALSRQRLYDTALIDRLHGLAMRGHQTLYGERAGLSRRVLSFPAHGFPRLVRLHAGLLAASLLLCAVPAAVVGLVARSHPEVAHAILGTEQMEEIAAMYDPSADHFARPREAGSDLAMFGFYILNNVGIAFRTFAGGILLGAGSIYFLILNGLLIAASGAYVVELGFGRTFFPFVSGHAAFELPAMVIAGAGGLRLGLAVLAPGRRTRSAALRLASPDAVGLALGAAGMLVVAACLEAFWSARITIEPPVKYGVAAVLWSMVITWLAFGGRREA